MSAEASLRHSLKPANANFSVWDTQYAPPSKAFSLYREAVCEVYMQWSPEIDAQSDFQARIETTKVRNASIVRHRCTPHVALRTPANIANSPATCSYLLLCLSGQGECEQRGRTTVAKSGDILAIDSEWPTKFTIGPPRFDVLVVTIPKADLDRLRDFDCDLTNVLLKQNRTPLAKCLNLMAERMICASKEETTSLYDACLSLLPLEAGCFERGKRDEAATAKTNYLLSGILSHIDRNIADADLAPNRVADRFGISVRYVHKLFIGCGTTFCAYTTSRRLDYICKDLTSPASRQQPISLVAFRWGFNDLSSFNRAFKSRFGCTPRQFRMRSEG
jgi:AraC-like DNA-binding protein